MGRNPGGRVLGLQGLRCRVAGFRFARLGFRVVRCLQGLRFRVPGFGD